MRQHLKAVRSTGFAQYNLLSAAENEFCGRDFKDAPGFVRRAANVCGGNVPLRSHGRNERTKHHRNSKRRRVVKHPGGMFDVENPLRGFSDL